MEGLESLRELEYIAWEKGYVGVYRVANQLLDEKLWGDYHVAVETDQAWRFQARGFRNLYAAVYVANVALCALCANTEKVNSFIVPQGVDVDSALSEIREWLRHERNRELSEKARLSPLWSRAVLSSFVAAHEDVERLTRDKSALLRDYGTLKREFEEAKELLATTSIELRVAQAKWGKVCAAEKSKIEAEYSKSIKPVQSACSCGGTNENCYKCGGSGVVNAA